MSEQAEARTPVTSKRRMRTVAWIGGAAAVLLVAGAIAVPQVVHAQRVDEYTALVAERDEAFRERAHAQTRLDAALALGLAQHGEVIALAQRVVALGQTPEPIMAAAHAQLLTEAGNAAITAVGATADTSEEATQAHQALAAAVETLRAEDAAAQAAAQESGAEAPASVAPTSFLALDTPTAATILDSERATEKGQTVADADVTPELIEETLAHVSSVRDDIAELNAAIKVEEDRMAGFTDAIESVMPALRTAAEGAMTQATHIAEVTPKAPDASVVAVTAAQHVQDVSTTEDAAQILDGLSAYIAAAQTAQAEHAAVVQREQEAAEAAAREQARRSTARTGNRGGSGGGDRGPQLCSRFQPDIWGGGGSLVLDFC